MHFCQAITLDVSVTLQNADLGSQTHHSLTFTPIDSRTDYPRVGFCFAHQRVSHTHKIQSNFNLHYYLVEWEFL